MYDYVYIIRAFVKFLDEAPCNNLFELPPQGCSLPITFVDVAFVKVVGNLQMLVYGKNDDCWMCFRQL